MNRSLRLAMAVVCCVIGLVARADQDLSDGVAGWAAPPFWTPPRLAAARSALSLGSAPLPFFSIPPCRVADTRGNSFSGAYGPPFMASNTPRDFTITGRCGIPAGAQAVSFNFTVTDTAGPGFLLVFPQGTPPPPVSTLNYLGAQTVANAAVVALGATGAVTTVAGVSGFDLVIDVNGYYAATGIIDSVNGLTGNVQIVPGTDLGVGVAGQTITVSVQSTSAAAPDTLVRRDGAGGFAAGTITANLNGNATSATTATTFLAPLAGDVTGLQGATTVAGLRGIPIAPAPPPAPGQVLTFGGATWAPASPFSPAWAQAGTVIVPQLVPAGANIALDTFGGSSGVFCAPFGCTITVTGLYQIDFCVQKDVGDGFDVLRNGISIPGSLFSSGSDVTRGRFLAPLNAGDLLQLRNPTLALAFLNTGTPGAQVASLQILQIGPP